MEVIMRKNKRGDISVMLLVIGVFAVCTLAIVSFILHEELGRKQFADIEMASNLSSQLEDFYFYTNSGLSREEAAERVGGEITGNKLVLNAEQIESKTILSIQYVVELD